MAILSRAASPGDTSPDAPTRITALDGWRGICILLVLAGHMLPLGPKSWGLNGPVAALGMAIFFTLSGFLIVNILLGRTGALAFLIRRLARIVPLAWLVLALVLFFHSAEPMEWIANFFFFANLPPFYLNYTGHFWSLGVEMQFYFAIAIAVLLFGKRGLILVPIAALAVTGLRIAMEQPVAIVTWFRVDEILAGGTLALLLKEREQTKALLRSIPFLPVAALFALSASQAFPALNYLRPYLCSLMVGITLVRDIPYLSPVLSSRPLSFLAQISYAVYVIHPYSMVGWLGSGEGIEKYLKRPICFALTFGFAIVSTFYYERRFIDWGHRITAGGWPDRCLAAQEAQSRPG